ncbi:hypothetical protein HanRHA438_Chr00c17g0851171 [Helianthus annuus]|nr:hypothetical protein HanRHA438_Chr00c17g0851171 [Helianthus annuus]
MFSVFNINRVDFLCIFVPFPSNTQFLFASIWFPFFNIFHKQFVSVCCECVGFGACNQHLVSEPSAREEDGVAVLRVVLVKTV